ncbi:hypothetical protein JYB87_10600 [Shewanella avicenniae]|uniref:Uncharacterized protein n=1 Tax=Shewanella avicenniae TaxID=2814294 RepID=A0ABX7QMK3_9GAMM|nr:hypothetical protein [Shewanella avicenniae]QSX32230.1 hypothetical protein JYB87_10600 [Shewanella avicenniae]
MKSTLWISCGVVIVGLMIGSWWLMDSAPDQDAQAQTVRQNEQGQSQEVSTTLVNEPSSASMAKATIDEKRELVRQCWDDTMPQSSDYADDDLSDALFNALANGTPYELLMQQAPTDNTSNYQMQLMRAWRYQQLLAQGYTDDESGHSSSDNEYLNSLSEQQRKIMVVEEKASQDFYTLTEQVKPLLNLNDAAFAEQTSDLTLSSGQFVGFMLQGLAPEKLALLLDRVAPQELTAQPLVINFTSSIPFLNIADYAAYALDVPLLQKLAERGVYPSQVDGVIGPIDRALLHRRMGQDDDQNVLAAVQYLVENGYKVAVSSAEDKEYLGSSLLNMQWVTVADEVKNYLMSHQATVPGVSTPPVTNPEIKAAISKKTLQIANVSEQRQRCTELAEQQLDAEGLMPFTQINELMGQLAEKYQGEALLDALQAEDPVLAALYEDHNTTRARGAHEQQLREALLSQDPVVALTELLQTTPLDSVDTSIVLMQLVRSPELLEAWNSRLQPVAPESLSALSYTRSDNLQYLVEQGFDLTVQDAHGDNLYSVFFNNAPDSVQWLLAEHIDPFSNRYGPDGLDYALDKSYIDNQLFAGTAQILQACLSLEPSHLRRMARLKQYRPEVYQALLALDPTIKLSDDIKPNVMLSINY